MLSSPATTQVCNSLGWLLDDAASGQNFVDLKLCTACQSTDLLLATAKLDSKNRCYTLACWWNDHESQGNWTWKPFTKLVSRLFVYSSKLAGVSSDGSRLYSLDFAAESSNPKTISWAKALLQGKVILWHGNVKAFHVSWTLHCGKIFWRASLNRIVTSMVSSSWYLEPNETWYVIFVGFPTMFELIWYHQQSFPSFPTLKSLRLTNSTWPKEPPHLCLYAKTKKCI